MMRFGGTRFGRLRRGVDPLAAFRRKLIAETELAILIGLTFPDRAPRIPRIEVGTGSFARRFSVQFWADTLGMAPDELRAVDSALAELHTTDEA